MKKLNLLPLVTLLFPLMVRAELTDSLKELEQVRLETGLCDMSDEEFKKIEASFKKVIKRSKQGQATAQLVIEDVKRAQVNCNKERLAELKEDILSKEPTFPMAIMDSFSTIEEERRLNTLAETFLKSKDNGDCEQIGEKDLYDNKKWHEVILKNGWSCVANNFKRFSQEINQRKGYADSQKTLEDLKVMKLPELKKIFKETYKDGIDDEKLKIALVPHLSWENGTLNTILPYKLFLSKTELTTYKYLVKEFKKLGVESTFIERNSLNPLDAQVTETKEKIKKLKGKYLIISRSMGARVMRELLVENDESVTSKISAYLNIGGTPHGSVIAQGKTHPDTFYRGTAPTITDIFKLPLGLITKDPRVPKHIEQTLYASLDRHNLGTMVPIRPREISESSVVVLNTVLIRNDYQRAAPLVDPVWMHMLQQGPTEGSSPLVGAAIDTANSIRLTLDSDHLGFWKYTPTEAMEIYLRILITAKQVGLVK